VVAEKKSQEDASQSLPAAFPDQRLCVSSPSIMDRKMAAGDFIVDLDRSSSLNAIMEWQLDRSTRLAGGRREEKLRSSTERVLNAGWRMEPDQVLLTRTRQHDIETPPSFSLLAQAPCLHFTFSVPYALH
jgi:hypothetical protein